MRTGTILRTIYDRFGSWENVKPSDAYPEKYYFAYNTWKDCQLRATIKEALWEDEQRVIFTFTNMFVKDEKIIYTIPYFALKDIDVSPTAMDLHTQLERIEIMQNESEEKNKCKTCNQLHPMSHSEFLAAEY